MKRQPFALPYAGIQPFADLSGNYASAAPVEPTVGDYFSDALGGLGIPREQALKLGSAFGLFPEGFRESGRALAAPFVDPSAGNIAGAGFEAALTAIPGAKGAKVAADAAEGAAKKAIKAYHGSPHDFDRFDMSKIGTGEGAQAYGHGLYFAEAEDTAKSYRDALSEPLRGMQPRGSAPPEVRERAAKIAGEIGGQDIDAAVAKLGRIRDRYISEGNQSRALDAEEDLRFLLDNQQHFDTHKGRMYEVNINADPEHFLDWDKPLAEQSEAVRGALKGYPPEMSASDAYRASSYGQMPVGFTPDGQALFDAKAALDRRNPSAASQALREAGIPGIRYLDQGSRGAGEGSSNYVVFDDKLVEILKKYGIALPFGLGAAGAGALGQNEPEVY
jgi:hypothetical protein